MTDCPWFEDVPVLQLMREAGDVYRAAYGGRWTAPAFSPQADVVATLGMSKQAAAS